MGDGGGEEVGAGLPGFVWLGALRVAGPLRPGVPAVKTVRHFPSLISRPAWELTSAQVGGVCRELTLRPRHLLPVSCLKDPISRPWSSPALTDPARGLLEHLSLLLFGGVLVCGTRQSALAPCPPPPQPQP